MATLTLTARSPYTIKYEITDITERNVDTAQIKLFVHGTLTVLQTTTFSTSDVSHVTKIVGYFTGLEPSGYYDIEEKIYDYKNRQTSSQKKGIHTRALNKDIRNTASHSINFLTSDEVYNTFENLCLVPSSRPSVSPPSLKSKYVDLPASDGVLDYTELLLGTVPFGRRTGSWTFYTDEQKMESLGYTWDFLYEYLLDKLHGQKVEIMLDDDQDYFYKGRISINQWRSSKSFSSIVIDYNCDSYKYSRTSSDDVDWQWDIALEEPDFTILYGNYAAQEHKVLNFINSGDQDTTPTYEVDAGEGLRIIIKANFGKVVQDVILGKYGSGNTRKQNLWNEGLCWQIVQNAVNEALGSSSRVTVPYDDPDPDVQARITATEALQSAGQLDTGTEYNLPNGTNYNEALLLKSGDNVFIVIGDGNIHTQYKETAL